METETVYRSCVMQQFAIVLEGDDDATPAVIRLRQALSDVFMPMSSRRLTPGWRQANHGDPDAQGWPGQRGG